MAAVPEWMRPPRPEGWYADDLDELTEAPRHTELIDGALVFMMSSPSRRVNYQARVWWKRGLTLAAGRPDSAPGSLPTI